MPHFFITFSETRIYSAMPLFMRVLVFSVSYFLTEKWKIFSCFLRGFPTSTTKNTTKILNENTKKEPDCPILFYTNKRMDFIIC